MSFRMDVRVEKVLEDGAYDAKLLNVEQKETKYGDRLMWTFEVDGENTEGVHHLMKAARLIGSGLHTMLILASFEPPKFGSEGRRPRPRSSIGPRPLGPHLY